MAATIRIAGTEATVTDGEWSSDDDLLARYLTIISRMVDPSPSQPSYDVAVAEYCAEALHGEVTSFDEPEYTEGRVY